MNGLQSLLGAPLAEAIAWSLLHLLWQGALVAGILGAALALLSHQSARTRYGVACGALVTLLILPVATAIRIYEPTTAALERTVAPIDSTQGSNLESTDQPIATEVQSEVAPTPLWIEFEQLLLASTRRHLPAVLLVWLTGVLFLSLRLLAGLRRANELATQDRTPASPEWQRVMARLCARMNLRRAITLIDSATVEVPTVIGWLRPVILLPLAALAGLSAQQVEMVLAHELAHIRRHDFLVNLLQAVVETLLFYHPAAWWISRQIRIERENCCDDLAVALCGEPLVYARALTQLEQARMNATVAVAATGGSLLSRVRRLAFGNGSHSTSRWTAGVALGAVLIALLGLPALPLLANRTATPAPAPKAKTDTVMDVSASRLDTPAPPKADRKTRDEMDSETPEAVVDIDVDMDTDTDPTPDVDMDTNDDPDCDSDAPTPDLDVIVHVPEIHLAPMAVQVLMPPMPAMSPMPLTIDLTDATRAAIADGAWGGVIGGVHPVIAARAFAYRNHSRVDVSKVKFSADGKLSVDELIALRASGVDAKYISDMKALRFNEPLETLVQMRMQGVTPQYVTEMRGLSLKADSPKDLIRLRTHGVGAEYVRQMRELGLGALSAEDLIRLRDHGVSATYAKEMAAAGYGKLSAETMITLRDHGVSPAYVQSLAAAGYNKLSTDDLVRLRDHGVNSKFLAALKEAGYTNLSTEEIIRLAESGVDADFILEMGKLRNR
jgi:beta-lactamase regulating signal transducer with metallopeptidase domain